MTKDREDLIARRTRTMGPAYTHFYQEPLYLVKGEGVWLYDSEDRRYLDCYNNAPSVGHCHPHVLEALQRQASTLNTHTRYLHHEIIEYGEMLTETLPGDLSVCSFVCTGTEANDLAYRIASVVTGHRGAITTSGAYHGNSTLVSELSPEYQRRHPAPDYIEEIEAPYTYRGSVSDAEPDYALRYAEQVDLAIDRLAARGHGLAMQIIDSIFDGRGVLTPPVEYQQALYQKVRAAGGLVVADEVQSGLTRLGDHYWGFMDSGVVPDIVTMGKPMGAGHPLAVVVTTPEIAAAFAKHTDYFNTFGGNPVSAAVGKAVLEVVQEDQLLANVKVSGDTLLAGLNRLAERFEWIGEVRGKGLFIGVELVTDRADKTPASDEAAQILESMRAKGVLISKIGEHGNILKIRPPLVFTPEHAQVALDALEQCFQELA